MIINGRNSNYKIMFCKCGCGDGILLKAEKDEDFGLSLQLVSDNFYSRQRNKFDELKEKIKRILYVITNKEYCYFDIVIDPKELQEFKEFVARL